MVATPVDRVDDLAAAIDRLARALAEATPAERAAAAACLQRLEPRALAPVPRPVSKRRALLALASAVVHRIAPHAPRRLIHVVERVKALAA